MVVAGPELRSCLVGQHMSLREFLKLPEEKPYLELWDGTVQQKVAPLGRHATLELRLGARLDAFGEANRLARVFSEYRFSFGRTAFVPDLAVFREERIKYRPDGEVADDFAAPPDIVIEIFSPGQTIRTLMQKCQTCIEQGVEIVLLIHTNRKWVRLFRGDGSVTLLQGSDRIDLDSVLPGFELTVDELFNLLRGP